MDLTVQRRGCSGPAVRDVQSALNRRMRPSPNLILDGEFGPATRRAVLAFQRKHWLVEDGEVGPCTRAALFQREMYRILHDVVLVSQPDESSCWLAATSMLLGESIPRSSVPPELISETGGLLNDSSLDDPVHRQAYAAHFNLRMYPPQSWSAIGLAEVLRRGPVATSTLWDVSGYVSSSGSSGHFRVIAGIRGDGSAIGTTLRICDPWPPNRGEVRSWGYHKLARGTPVLTYHLFQRQG